jgi:hypothetical protein
MNENHEKKIFNLKYLVNNVCLIVLFINICNVHENDKIQSITYIQLKL